MEDASASSPQKVAAVAELVDEVSGLLRVAHAVKAQLASRSAHSLLFPLAAVGPVRLTTLADMVHVDPSTTSRQVGELVRAGLVRREPDPADRRAQLLVVTDAGRAAVAQLREERTRAVADALEDWSAEELAAFSCSFRRFTAGMVSILGGSVAAPTPATPTSQEDR